jgi:hypothetical protein
MLRFRELAIISNIEKHGYKVTPVPLLKDILNRNIKKKSVVETLFFLGFI